jgi:hypothetical protein
MNSPYVCANSLLVVREAMERINIRPSFIVSCNEAAAAAIWATSATRRSLQADAETATLFNCKFDQLQSKLLILKSHPPRLQKDPSPGSRQPVRTKGENRRKPSISPPPEQVLRQLCNSSASTRINIRSATPIWKPRCKSGMKLDMLWP